MFGKAVEQASGWISNQMLLFLLFFSSSSRLFSLSSHPLAQGMAIVFVEGNKKTVIGQKVCFLLFSLLFLFFFIMSLVHVRRGSCVRQS